jgi:hypothetical protein
MGSPAASAAAGPVWAEGPVWNIVSTPSPTIFQPGEHGDLIVVSATNIGGAASDGAAVTVSASLPAGLTVEQIVGTDAYRDPRSTVASGNDLVCVSTPVLACTDSRPIDPGDTLIVKIEVAVEAGLPAASLTSDAEVSGGGAQDASTTSAIALGSTGPGSTAPAFGIARRSFFAATSSDQAGAHANVTTGFTLNTVSPEGGGVFAKPVATPRDVSLELPPGLAGDVTGIPRCTMAQVANSSNCPSDTRVGTATVTIAVGDRETVVVPVFNIVPYPGEPIALAFDALAFTARFDASVLSDGDYAVRMSAQDLTEASPALAASMTIWGVPADHSGPGEDETYSESGGSSFGGPSPGQTRLALMTNPQRCAEPLIAHVATDAWEKPGVLATESASMGELDGCERLSFEPTFSMLPDTTVAGAPAGYTLDLKLAQDTSPDGLATPTFRQLRVALPVGTVISPSAGTGLRSCSDAQFLGPDGAQQEPATPAQCPAEAQIGTLQIESPALEEPLTGKVYLGEPLCGAGGTCSPEDAEGGRMVRLFAQASDEGEDNLIVKVQGAASINQQTGQIVVTFEEAPQLPSSEFKLDLDGGQRALLANSRTCGPTTTTAAFTPWSAPLTPISASSFDSEIDEGCVAPEFSPTFLAGTTDAEAGAFSPLTLSFGRSDADEYLSRLQVRLPPGLLGALSTVPPCGEPQASDGTCAVESLIGHVQALVGPGTEPYLIGGGQLFLTDGYDGSPFGLSIVLPADAGPFALAGTTGHGTVVVRAAIDVDPNTAAVTITSDPFPTALDGIPLQVREVSATIDRPGFMFNPTSCDRAAIGGTLTSAEGATAAVSSPFQVANCAALAFKPQFKASTSGRTSSTNGASLDLKLSFPGGGAPGDRANLAKIKIDLPKQLPSRLTTLHKACPARVFAANPATCPPGSLIGIVRADTPLLASQLTGPVYFVSNGGEAFPNVALVLQGDGVRMNLIGDTYVSTHSITSTTFRQIPDVPISSFELYLPQGPTSALGSFGDLCTSRLTMPTSLVSQDGRTISQSTAVTVTGCRAKAAPKKRSKKSRRKAIRATHKGKGKAR